MPSMILKQISDIEKKLSDMENMAKDKSSQMIIEAIKISKNILKDTQDRCEKLFKEAEIKSEEKFRSDEKIYIEKLNDTLLKLNNAAKENHDKAILKMMELL